MASQQQKEVRMAKGIYERRGKYGDITYYIRYAYQGTDVKEKIGKKSRGFTREVAKEALRSRLGDIARGRFQLRPSSAAAHVCGTG